MASGLNRLEVGFDGLVYRAHHPGWAYQPISGEGAERHSGRFNRKGLAALYTALDLTTAWLEAQQGFPFKAQPTTLVAYRVRCERIADLTDTARLARPKSTPPSSPARGKTWPAMAFGHRLGGSPTNSLRQVSKARWSPALRRRSIRHQRTSHGETWFFGGGRMRHLARSVSSMTSGGCRKTQRVGSPRSLAASAGRRFRCGPFRHSCRHQ